MKKIKIRLGSQKSINAAIAELDRELKTREQKLNTFIERLAEIGRQTAAEIFATAQYDGTNDIVVTAEKTARGYKVVASGNAVAFIEFGSGVTMPPYPADAAVQHGRGVYGRGQGANEKGWIYVGEQGTGGIPVMSRKGEVRPGVYRTKGNPPAAAMYYAVRAMQEAAPQIAREVFG